MNKARFTFKNRFLFIGYLFAFFIINELIFGSVIVNGGMVYETVEVEITVDVTKDYGEAHQNEIVIEPMNENNPMPGDNQKKSNIEVEDNKSGSFKISFNEPGEYEYKIYQKTGTNDCVEYDEKVYHATIMVMDNNGKLDTVLSIKIEGVNTKPEKVQFVNIEKEETADETVEEPTDESTEETTEETTQKGSGEDDTEVNANNPTTGDDFPLDIVIMIMLSSAALIFALIYVKIKLDQSEKEDSEELEEDSDENENESTEESDKDEE